MAPNAIKTIIFASAVVLLSSFTDSVDARNQSVAAHHHKHAHQHQKAESCKTDCPTEFDLARYKHLCYHKIGDHVNWFYRIEVPQPYVGPLVTQDSKCGCCDNKITYSNDKGHWHKFGKFDVTWCYSPDGRGAADEWYTNLNLQCEK